MLILLNQLEICVDLDADFISACSYIKFPIVPFWKQIGCTEGSLKDGIKIEFDNVYANGYLRFYRGGDDWVHMEYDITVIVVGEFKGDIPLFPLSI
jgi:hypothetical protein